jgi:hypothetical protein
MGKKQSSQRCIHRQQRQQQHPRLPGTIVPANGQRRQQHPRLPGTIVPANGQRRQEGTKWVEAKVDTQDVDFFVQSYLETWRGANIWLVLVLGQGATLELKTKSPSPRLTLNDENVPALLLAWDIFLARHTRLHVRILYEKKLQRHRSTVTEENLRLLSQKLVFRSFSDDITLNLQNVFGHNGAPLSDEAYRELLILLQTLFPLRSVWFKGGSDGQCWWNNSIGNMQHFCHRVLCSSTSNGQNNAAGLVFSYSNITEKDWVQFCIAQQYLLRWLETHHHGVPVSLQLWFDYEGTTSLHQHRVKVLSRDQLAYYLQCALWEEEEEVEKRVYWGCDCWLERPCMRRLINWPDFAKFLENWRHSDVCSTTRCRHHCTFTKLSLRHFGLQDDDMEWICRGLVARGDSTNFRGTIDLTGNTGITEQGWWTLLCFAVSSRTTLKFVVSSAPLASSGAHSYQKWFDYITNMNRHRSWLMDAMCLIYPDANELTSLLFTSGNHSWYRNFDASDARNTYYRLLRHDPTRWALTRRSRRKEESSSTASSPVLGETMVRSEVSVMANTSDLSATSPASVLSS